MKASLRALCVIGLSVLSRVSEASPLGKELYQAVQVQDTRKIEALIKKGADFDYKENGRPTLVWAGQMNNVEVVRALLKGGANPNVTDDLGHSALIRSIDTQSIEVTRELLKGKADPNVVTRDGDSALMFAVRTRQPEFVRALIEAKVDVTAVNSSGNSPALEAAQDGFEESREIITLLGRAGANLNASTDIYTPLVFAVEQGRVEVVKTLLNAGADPNVKTKAGKAPIHKVSDNVEILELLLSAKADPNAQDALGATALINAVESGFTPVVAALLKAKGDPTLADNNGRTPRSMIEFSSDQEMVALLKPKDEPVSNGEVVDATNYDPPAGYDPNRGADKGCTIVDAARKQMEVHGLLQKQVTAGKMQPSIFNTFNDDTSDFARMLTEDPPAACELLERLRKKYGV